VSQFFICLAPAHIDESIIDEIIGFAKSSSPADEHSTVRYPGEQTLKNRKKSEAEGIEVNDNIWNEVKRF
jgi:3-dehydro-L-gulonate 2-dehydrogenase